MPQRQSRYPHHQSSEQQQQQLQISSFIKDPATLKLLILAGTNIKSSQLSTVAKCSNLIKLDLSSNMLTQIPIHFGNFVQLKILYLHDNSIFHVEVKNQTVEYMTLFNNPFKNYRSRIIDNNPNLMALDYHVITHRQRNRNHSSLQSLQSFTQLKWPIVQSSTILQNEQDYLNLLKAQIFVITNLHKRSNNIEKIEWYVDGFRQFCQYQKSVKNLGDEMRMKKACVIEAVHQWKRFVWKKGKLGRFLKEIGKQHLLYNNLDVRKARRSPRTNEIIERFIKSIRDRLSARRILQPQLRSYRQYMPTARHFIQIYKTACASTQYYKLYFLKSQLHLLNKIFLYAKRLLFNKRQYDRCDNFERLVSMEKKQYYIYRIKGKNIQERSFLRQAIRRTVSMVVTEKNVDRKHFLYTKKGHRLIGLKNRGKRVRFDQNELANTLNKLSYVQTNIQQMYDNYDSLISYKIVDNELFQLLMRIIRYFNSGNSRPILSNQTAYFQTQITYYQNSLTSHSQQRIFIGLNFFIQRVLAANVIQRFWRRKINERKCTVDVIKTIKSRRAGAIISHWWRELPFRQRLLMNKMYSYKKTVQKTTDLYIQLDVYMNLPHPTNLLKIPKYDTITNNSNQILYYTLHKNTYVQIIQLCRRKWIRIVFPSVQKALHAYKLFLFTTFRFYYNGFYLQLFSYFQAQEHSQLQIYQKRVKNLYKIQVKKSLSQSSINVSKKLIIQNTDAYFIWPEVGQRGVQQRYEMQKSSLPISIFVYNKHQKPLKINCEFNWIHPLSIYYYRSRILKSTSYNNSIRSRTPTKRLQSLSSNKTRQDTSFIRGEDIHKHYLNKIRSIDKRDRRSSDISPHNTVLLRNHRFKNRNGVTENIQVDLLSQTIAIKRK